MIGNDIVDLRDAETASGAQHSGFDRRVFRDEERDAIGSAADPRRLRWMFWAAKEAAYKALRRDDPGFVFSPRALEVELQEDGRGRVRAGCQTLALQVDADGECVVALARRREVTPESISLHAFLREPDRTALRATLVRRLREEALRRGIAGGWIALERHGRIPSLRLRQGRLPVSIAHHGRFAGAAVVWPFAVSPEVPIGTALEVCSGP